MNKQDVVEKIIHEIRAYVTEDIHISQNDALVGGSALLDSVGLVEVCLALEDFAEEEGFVFDWTSETALSKSKGMFRSIDQLASEFISQRENTN